MTPDQSQNAYNQGQTRFWLALLDDAGEIDRFIKIGDNPAIRGLHLVIDLPYGDYVLGTGYGRCKLRKKLRVDLHGAKFL